MRVEAMPVKGRGDLLPSDASAGNRPRRIYGRVFAILALSSGLVSTVGQDLGRPAESGEKLFADHVRPLFEIACLKCHGGEKKKANLSLATREGLLQGGESGPAVVPGNARLSLLYKTVAHLEEPHMPQGKERLPKEVIDRLAAWIDAGAPYSGTIGKQRRTATHWAFTSLKQVEPPDCGPDGFARTPVDRFVLFKLREKGLSHAPEADRLTLIRRATFDLTGLPPEPEEVDAFLKDSSPQAYEKLIDRLLASKSYGERWGRHWLDVARYADSGGFVIDIYLPNAWRYRDYVIKSFNDDKPYDRFVQEQIAGDELWPDNLELGGLNENGKPVIPKEKLDHLEARLGTGLYSLAPLGDQNRFDGELRRHEWLSDAINVTGSAFLGLTLECAQCHDHKSDPVTQREYYSLQSIFAGSEVREIPTVDENQIHAYWSNLLKERRTEEMKEDLKRLEKRAAERKAAREKEGVARGPRHKTTLPDTLLDEILSAYQVASGDRATRKRHLADSLTKVVPSLLEEIDEDGYTREERATREALTRSVMGAVLNAKPRYPVASVLGHALVTPDIFVATRGDPKKRGPKVAPGLPAALGAEPAVPTPTDSGTFTLRRKALALWLTRPDHPLTARVMVNRVWHWHFGRGLVSTPGDFGLRGSPPTHPELLDWMAVEFVRRGWSIKELHRLILCSSVYRMASAYQDPHNAKLDPDNLYLWRMIRRRLEAEAIRDAVLSVSGNLNRKAGGPPVIPPLSEEELFDLGEGGRTTWPETHDPEESRRRSIFLFVKRSFPLPMFAAFDAPSTTASCARRNATTVPSQALWLMNNRFMVEQARALAARVAKASPSDPSQQVATAWQLAFSRTPNMQETADAVAFLKGEGSVEGSRMMKSSQGRDALPALARLCLVLLNLNEFVYVD